MTMCKRELILPKSKRGQKFQSSAIFRLYGNRCTMYNKSTGPTPRFPVNIAK